MDLTAAIDFIADQEKALVLPSFNMEAAWQIGSIARSIAVERKHVIVIQIRRNGVPVFITAVHDTTGSHAEWARRKANVCEFFQKSSYRFALLLQQKNQTLERHALSARDYAADGGSFPIAVAGAGVIGSLTVSGLDQHADHELAVEALCAYLKKPYASLQLAP